MAWKSVHESIDGPKLRALSKQLKCSKFEAAGILNFLWLWGLHNADKHGCVMCADREDIQWYLDGAGGGTKLRSENIVSALFKTGWLEHGNNEQIIIHDWEFWQKEWYRYNERREADTMRKRKVKETLAAAPPPSIETPKEPQKPSASTEPSPKPKAKMSTYSEGFRAVWEEYPRKDDKAAAYAKYKARLTDGHKEQELLEAVRGYASEVRRTRQQKEYILMGKTFFAPEGRFTQYIPKENRTAVMFDEDNPFPDSWKGS